MNVSGSIGVERQQSNASTTSKTDAAIDELNDTYNNFLLLLTKQLQNQDPLNPMDTAQFTQQLVGFSQWSSRSTPTRAWRADRAAILHQRLRRRQLPRQRGGGRQRPLSLKDGKAKFQYEIDAGRRQAMLRSRFSGKVVLVQEANAASAPTTSIGTARTPSATSCRTASTEVAVAYRTTRARLFVEYHQLRRRGLRPRSPTARSNCSSVGRFPDRQDSQGHQAHRERQRTILRILRICREYWIAKILSKIPRQSTPPVVLI
jgi:flagellar basal-body rod modification protein FlgD